jgi:hypothetical protein
MVGAPPTNYTWKATPTSGVAFSRSWTENVRKWVELGQNKIDFLHQVVSQKIGMSLGNSPKTGNTLSRRLKK